MSQTVKFDSQAYVNSIREKIRGHIVEAVPDEAWDAMIREEMDRFMTDRVVERSGYSSRETIPSGARQVIVRVMTADIEAKMKALLSSPEWAGQWTMDKVVAGELVGKLMVKHGGEIMNAWLETVMQQTLNGMRNRT